MAGPIPSASSQPAIERVNVDRLSEVATYQLLRTTTIPVLRLCV